MSAAELGQVIAEFKKGDFTNRDKFITAHTRLATSVGMKYGYRNNLGDELVGVTLHELCKFPDRVRDGHLKNDKVLTYLLSRLHNSCRDYISRDIIYGPSRGHVANTGVVVKRETSEATGTKEARLKEQDFVLDLKSLCKTDKEQIVLEYSLEGKNDQEIRDHFGWRSSHGIAAIMRGVLDRYRQTLYEPLVVYLPYPDFKSSVRVLSVRDLKNQTRLIREILESKHASHPSSLIWCQNFYQLANYGLYCSDAINDRDSFDWLANKRVTFANKSFPSWFDNDHIHENHRAYLLYKDKDYYGQFGWTEEPSAKLIWPGVNF